MFLAVDRKIYAILVVQTLSIIVVLFEEAIVSRGIGIVGFNSIFALALASFVVTVLYFVQASDHALKKKKTGRVARKKLANTGFEDEVYRIIVGSSDYED